MKEWQLRMLVSVGAIAVVLYFYWVSGAVWQRGAAAFFASYGAVGLIIIANIFVTVRQPCPPPN